MQKFYFTLIFSVLCGLLVNAQTTIIVSLDLNATPAPASCNGSPPAAMGEIGFVGFLNPGMPDPNGEEFYTLSDPDGDGIWTATITFSSTYTGGMYLQGVYSINGVRETVTAVNNSSCGTTNSNLGRDQFANAGTTVNKPTDYWEECDGTACVTAMPVELTSFKGEEKVKGAVFLQWETASELNNDYFSVEYSTDGNRFEALGRVDGQGTTTAANGYDFTHEAPSAKMNYYRLKQVDYDGQYEYSDIVSIKMNLDNDRIGIIPTIAKDIIQVQYEGAEVEVAIFNINGQKVHQQRKNFENGFQELSVVDLPNGIYIVRILDQKNIQLQAARFIKQ